MLYANISVKPQLLPIDEMYTFMGKYGRRFVYMFSLVQLMQLDLHLLIVPFYADVIVV